MHIDKDILPLLVTGMLAAGLVLVGQGCASTGSSADARSPQEQTATAETEDRETAREETTPRDWKETARGDEPNRGGEVSLDATDPQVALERLVTPEGYTVNLFASEEAFPDLRNPNSMTFDAEGRLWVGTMPSYPQYLPGHPPNDKILILEDTDGDGRADTQITFADSLYLPGGFELGDGGVYVAQQPNLVFLRDTDGDDRADVRRTILHGFGTGDSHHAISTFTWGPGGGLYFQDGTFLYSNVETPYGPVRLKYGGVFRYEPTTERFRVFASYPFANPWGHAFNRWGQNFIADASGGDNYFALPISGRVAYPRKHPPMQRFTTKIRPTAGIELLRSRHFPDSLQGTFLINNVIGFQGTMVHRVVEERSGYNSEEVGALLYSTDRTFRPVDVDVGPDGALYVVDWFNPLIGHMQYSIRDERRDSEHGRIWRLTAEGRPLLDDPEIAGQSIPELLDLLKTYEDNVRYRVRRELRLHDSEAIEPALTQWMRDLDETDPVHALHLLEALWVCQTHQLFKPTLLRRLLRSENPHARAAATRVLRFWLDKVDDPLALLAQQIDDDHPRVRLEAVVALSDVPSAKAADVALEALRHPMDYYLDYGLHETLRTLKPYWLPRIAQNAAFSADHPAGRAYAMELVETDRLVEMTRREPVHPAVYRALLTRDDVSPALRRRALAAVAAVEEQSTVAVLVRTLETLRPTTSQAVIDTLGALLVEQDRPVLASHEDGLKQLAVGAGVPHVRRAGYVALMRATGSVEEAWRLAAHSVRGLYDLAAAVPQLNNPALQRALYPHLKTLVTKLPPALDGAAVAGRFLRVHSTDGVDPIRPSQFEILGAEGVWTERARPIPVDRGTAWEVDLGAKTTFDALVTTNRAFEQSTHLAGYTLSIRDEQREPVVIRTTEKPRPRSHAHRYGTVTEGPRGGHAKPPLDRPSPSPNDTLHLAGTVTEADVHRAALSALPAIPYRAAETFDVLTEQIEAGRFVPEAAAGILSISRSEWPAARELRSVGDDLLARAQEIPIEARSSASFRHVVALGLEVAARLPEEDGQAMEQAINDLVQVITIQAVEGEMRYDVASFSVEAGHPVVILFENYDAIPHNVVFVTPGSMEEVGRMADAMAGDPDAFDEGFIPDTDEILWHTALLDGGDEAQLSFTAPEAPGTYPYVCTFPGHWITMNGVMNVTAPATSSAAGADDH